MRGLRHMLNAKSFYLFDNFIRVFGLDLTLDSVSEQAGHIFTINIEFKDGTLLSFETPEVLLH